MSAYNTETYNEILKCNRCGFCQPHCPTYNSTRDETQLARGRIQMVRLICEGQYDWDADPALIEKVNDCLLCGACTKNCPASVKTDEIMRAFRENYLDQKGPSLIIKMLYRGLLSHRDRLERASALIRLYNKSGARGVVASESMKKVLQQLHYWDSFLPPDISAPLRRRLPAVIKPEGKTLLKARFFLGCASNVFASKSVETMLLFLARKGVEVEITDNVCCGEPHRSVGDSLEVNKLAAHNAKAVFGGDYDFIISECSTCVSALAQYDRFVDPNSQEAEIIGAGLAKVTDLNSFVLEHLNLNSPSGGKSKNTIVTYHDPCHAIRGLGIKDAPREILKSVPGVDFIEMKGADVCCGGAGSYGATHQEVASAIAQKKTDNFIESGADILSTSCPSCTLQLGAALRRTGLAHPVKHPVEILAEADVK